MVVQNQVLSILRRQSERVMASLRHGTDSKHQPYTNSMVRCLLSLLSFGDPGVKSMACDLFRMDYHIRNLRKYTLLEQGDLWDALLEDSFWTRLLTI